MIKYKHMKHTKISFSVDKQKILEAIKYIMGLGETRPYHIMKVLFEADKFHINTYGRPVSGDYILAEPHGTTPKNAKDIIVNTWNIDPDFFNNNNNLINKGDADITFLSGSDKKALQAGFDKYANKTKEEVELINHNEVSWKRACEEGLDTVPTEYFADNQDTIRNLITFGQNIVF